MATLDKQLPGILIETLREQWARVQSLDNVSALIEGQLKRALAETPTCKMISDIPGVGLMTATAAVTTMGDPASFKKGENLLPGWGWCRGKQVQEDEYGNGASPARRCLFPYLVNAWRARHHRSANIL
jgi:hypothetical protein